MPKRKQTIEVQGVRMPKLLVAMPQEMIDQLDFIRSMTFENRSELIRRACIRIIEVERMKQEAHAARLAAIKKGEQDPGAASGT